MARQRTLLQLLRVGHSSDPLQASTVLKFHGLPALVRLIFEFNVIGCQMGTYDPRRSVVRVLIFSSQESNNDEWVFEMGAQEDVALVRRGYEAFIAGDMDTLRELFTEDAVWHTSGSGATSGDKRGRDAILAYFGELGSRTNGSLKVTLEDVAVGDKYTVGVQSNHAEREGKILDGRSVVVFTITGGKVIEVLEIPEDTAASADFWS